MALALVWGAPAAAQEPQRADSLEREVRVLRARLDSLQLVLEGLVQAGRDTGAVIDELAALRAAARQAADEAGTPDTAQGGSRTRNLQMLNPEISVTGDVVGNYVMPGDQENAASAVPREFEFSFQAALDPYTRTKIFVTKEEDFEIAGLSEEEAEQGEEGHGFEIEEGYMYWVGLPGGFGAKIGRFRQDIGLYNRWHTHALFEVERPLAATTFLGEDGLIQTGAAITLPSFTLGPATQTVTIEAARGNNEALFEGGSEFSFLGRLQNFWDLGANAYFQLGTTGVYGENDDAELQSLLLGFDVAFRWAPAQRALYREFQLKGEWYYGEKDIAGATITGSGGYAQANYRLSRQWIVGVRGDYVNRFDGAPDIYQVAPSITWWQSEWVRLRVQYNYVRPDGGPGNHTMLIQSVWAIGPHKHEIY
jgi:hypothetical protein